MSLNRNAKKVTQSSNIGIFINEFKKLITSNLFNGFIAFSSLITAVFSKEPLIRFSSIIILLGCLIVLRKVVLKLIKYLISWRLILGVAIGIFIGIACFPYISEIVSETCKLGVSPFIPKVEVIDTKPINGGTLENLYDGVEIRFSERVLPKYSKYIDIDINPYIQIDETWIYEYNPSEGYQKLYIRPAKYFKNHSRPQFQPNTKYYLQIKGSLIKTPLTIAFQTPKDVLGLK